MRLTLSIAMLSMSLVACATDEAAPEEMDAYAEDEKADAAFESRLQGVRNEWSEVIRPDEATAFAAMATKMNELQALLAATNGGTAQRGFHAKTHGCMTAEFQLNASRPAETRFGVFAGDDGITPGAPGIAYQAWMRLSNGQGKSLVDNERDVRGLAIKLVSVEGDKLFKGDGSVPGDIQVATTQDFLMTTRPASHVNDAVEFMEFAAAAATGKIALWALKHPVAAGRLFGGTSPVKTLATQFWSGSPYRVGPKIAKFKVWPCAGTSANTLGTTTDDPNFLRTDIEHRLAYAGLCYEFGVQLRKDPANESVEKGSSVWSELRNPFIPVARLVVAQRSVVTARTDEAYCTDLSFNPWHGLVAHQPLGHLNRARRPVYVSSSSFRGRVDEPGAH